LFHFFLSVFINEHYPCISTTMKLSLLFAVVVSMVAVSGAPTRETNGMRMNRGLPPLPPVKRTSIREHKRNEAPTKPKRTRLEKRFLGF